MTATENYPLTVIYPQLWQFFHIKCIVFQTLKLLSHDEAWEGLVLAFWRHLKPEIFQHLTAREHSKSLLFYESQKY